MAKQKRTKFLVSDTNPDGLRVEDILRDIRNDILIRCSTAMADGRPDTEHVMSNNMHILGILSDAIALAEDSTDVLTRMYGPAQAATGTPPPDD